MIAGITPSLQIECVKDLAYNCKDDTKKMIEVALLLSPFFTHFKESQPMKCDVFFYS